MSTTKILALGTLTTQITADQQRDIMPKEVPGTVRLYLEGVIDQWFARKDGKGVAFLLNITSVEEAHALLEALPLGKANLMTFELIPLGPLFPLGMLLDQ
jgi:hypothetical protein